MSDRLADLNPAQRDAVLTLSGPLLILAGAGTGKTRVITHRMIELIENGTPPDRILSVTFTNKAAKEMLERTSKLLNKRSKQKPVISTFHSYCVKVLRQEIELLGYPKTFSIYDRGDQESAARKALRDVRVADTSLSPEDLLSIISRWKTNGVRAEEAANHTDSELDFIAAVAYRKYQSNLRACGAVDFDDLLMLTNRLFEDFPDALERQQRRFDFVQIDEYQDTNGSQFELIEALVRQHHNLCVVGDDDQSIYGWRGAEVTHILNFQHLFKGAKVVRLEENYRCTERIIDIANRLVKHNKGRHDKQLRANKKSDAPIKVREYEDEVSEAENLVAEIKFLTEKKGVPAQDICILVRTNEQPRPFEAELRRCNVRYVLMGTQSFFDRREIRDVLAYLKAIENPRDENALLRVINVPARGIGDTTIEKLLKRAVRDGCSLHESLPAALAEKEVSAKAAAAINGFYEMLAKYRQRLLTSPKQLPEVCEQLLEEINYDSEIQKQYENEDIQMARGEIIEQLIDQLRSYVSRAETPSLSEFLEETSLDGRQDNDKEKKLEQEAIKLMTLHSAKGLEFPRVYMVGLEEGILPHKRSLEEEGKAIDEERRLAYVGITRARDHLTLSRCATRRKWGKKKLCNPSRFLREMLGLGLDVELPK